MDLGLVGKSLATLPLFVAYMAVSLALVGVFLAVYTSLTPYREWQLIRDGNVAAAISLGGALIGFALPLANVVAHTNILLDVVVWGVVALVVQLFIWAAANAAQRGLKDRITRGDAAAGVFVAATSIAGGIINAACMTY